MDLSGVIFVALAVVWAVVLIPKALKHHDEVAKTRTAGKVSDSLRVLARRERSGDGDERLVVGAEAAARVPVQRPSVDEAPARPRIPAPRPATRSEARKAAVAAARRRRRVLAVLLLSLIAVTVGSVSGLLQPWAPAIPAGLSAAYLVLCRILVKRERATAVPAGRPLRVVEPVVEDAAPAAVVAPEPEVRNQQGLAVVGEGEDTSAHDFTEVREAVGGAVGSLWDPLPMTLPTYVTKPRATRSVRTIDLNAPGVTSSGRGVGDSVPSTSAADDELAPRDRAVGS